MMIRIPFNLNNHVHVELTNFGRKVLIDEGLEKHHQPGADGKHSFQMWELMQIFGKFMYNGCPRDRMPFEEMNVEIEASGATP